MSEAIESVTEEPQANPYNSRKEWHTPDAPSKGDANGLFFEETTTKKQATQKSAPEETVEKETKSTNYKKRYDDLKKHYDQKIADFKQKELELKAAAQTQQMNEYRPPKTLEDLEEFKTQYPDLYETVESVAHLQSEQQLEAIRTKLSAIEEREAAISRREAETALQEKHPDFDEIRGDDKFHEWAKEQPESIQDWIYNNPDNVELAIKAIDLYKIEAGISTPKTAKTRKSQPTSSAADFVSTKTTTVDAKQPKIWTQREISALSMAQFDKLEDEIDQAIMEGRVVP